MESLAARRALRWTGASAAVAAPVAAGVAYVAARELTAAAAPRVRQPTMRARFRDDGLVELEGDRADDPGSWGLRLPDAFVRIDDVLDIRGAATVRPYVLLEGKVPSPEVDATITPYAWPDDPQVLARHTGAEFRVDGVSSGGHVLPTWLLRPQDARDTWMVAVHGRSSSRTELFRLTEIALRNRIPVLVASYRTDVWTAAPAPVTTLGTTEWRDVEANVAAALASGAKQVVLAGCSLGGGLVAQVVRRSLLAPWISGVVLDSPALSWGRTLRHVAGARRIPEFLVPAIMAAARLRARIDWEALDHLTAVDEFAQPVLVLHGEDDDIVPVWTSEAFATARPDLVTLEVFPGATHVTSWNHAPQRYVRAVERFLSRIAS